MIIRVEGVENSINALAALDKKAYGVIAKEMRAEANVVLDEARALTPGIALSRWGAWTLKRDGRDFSYSPDRLKNTLKTSVRRRQQSSRRLASVRIVAYSKDPVAIIYQTAGRGEKANDPFARNITRNWGEPEKRYLWAAIDSRGDQARDRINSLMDRAANEVQHLLDRAA